MMPNVAQFFPGLGGALPPAIRTAEAAGPVDGKVHRFSTSSTMVVDPNVGKDVLKVLDIAKYPSPKPVHPAGSTFATTREYIAYTVKGGSVRVIHQQSGVKTLLKGQSQQLVDIAFTDMSLATCGEDGLCILWDILISGQDESTTMEAADTLRLRAPVGDGMQRAKFHPKDSHLLFIAHGPTVSGIRLNQHVWEIFKSFPAKESGIPIEQVQSFSITGSSAQKVNDFAFSDDGSMLATAGNDGSVLVYGINLSKDGDIRLLARFDLSKPVVFVSFVLNSVVCGFSHCEELAMINPEGREIHRIRFTAAVSGTAVRFRAASVERGRYIVLCDSNVPAMVLVQADETGFKTATTIQLPSPVIAFSVLSDDGSVSVNAVTDALIQVFELPPLNTLLPAPLPMAGNGVPEQRALPSVSQPLTVPPQPVQPKGVGLPPLGQQPGMFQPTPAEQPRYSPAVPPVFNNNNPQVRSVVNANAGSQSMNMGDLERMLDEKLGYFAGKIEAQIRESEERNKKQLMSLVEAISSTMVDLQPAIQESVVTYFKSPEYAENLAVAIKAGLDASGQKTVVDKAVKAALPHAMKELGETLTNQLNTRIQQNLNKSFEEAFRQRLVPAFEIGCTNMLRQFEVALSRRVGGGFSKDLKARENVQESIDDAIAQGDFALALERAVNSDDPNILTSTCDRVDFTNLLAGGYPLSQTLLVNLLRAFAKNITHEPSKRLEWIETISTGNIDRTSPEIADVLPSVALQAKDALVSNSEIFAKLGTTRFRSAVFLLNVLAGGV